MTPTPISKWPWPEHSTSQCVAPYWGSQLPHEEPLATTSAHLSPKSFTLHPTPQSPKPKAQTLNLKPYTLNSKPPTLYSTSSSLQAHVLTSNRQLTAIALTCETCVSNAESFLFKSAAALRACCASRCCSTFPPLHATTPSHLRHPTPTQLFLWTCERVSACER